MQRKSRNIKQRKPTMITWDLTGYKLQIMSWYGRLGNNILQLCCALFIAEQTKSTLTFPNHGFIRNKIFDFRKLGQENCGKVITDEFFGHTMLKNLNERYTELEQVRISQEYIYPLLNVLDNEQWRLMSPKKDFDTTLVIHMRSGDSMRTGVNKNYIQPPLSVYKKVILEGPCKFSHVLIVTEKDLLNPCINGLKIFCDELGISCFIQSTSLQNDVTTIVNARYLVTSQSSFSWSFLRCNKYCKTVFIPNIRFPGTPLFPDKFIELPYEQYYYGLEDYICAKQWLYSPAQLKIMVTYPIEKIQVKIVNKIQD
jgi:hypothetical protein